MALDKSSLVMIVVVTVTGAWAISFVMSMIMLVIRDDPLTNSVFIQVTAVFTAIVGGFMFTGRGNGNGRNGGNGGGQ